MPIYLGQGLIMFNSFASQVTHTHTQSCCVFDLLCVCLTVMECDRCAICGEADVMIIESNGSKRDDSSADDIIPVHDVMDTFGTSDQSSYTVCGAE